MITSVQKLIVSRTQPRDCRSFFMSDIFVAAKEADTQLALLTICLVSWRGGGGKESVLG